MKKVILILCAFAISACQAEKTIDASSQLAFDNSLEAMTEGMETSELEELGLKIGTIMFDGDIWSAIDLTDAEQDALIIKLDGMTLADIDSKYESLMALQAQQQAKVNEEIQLRMQLAEQEQELKRQQREKEEAERAQRERDRDIADLKRLLQLKADHEQQVAILESISLTGEAGLTTNPLVSTTISWFEATIKNSLPQPISAVDARVVLIGEGRSVPWSQGTQKLRIDGGVEPGEAVVDKFFPGFDLPGMKSQIAEQRPDDILLFEVIQAYDAAGSPIVPELFGRSDQYKLDRLLAKYPGHQQ